MYLLTKAIDDTVLYWQVWEYEGLLIEMQGEVGKVGFGTKTPLAMIKDVQLHMENQALTKQNQGYLFFEKGDSTMLMIQIPLTTDDALEKEELIHKAVTGLNLSLQWSGNGTVHSTEISEDYLELKCNVINPEAASASIEKTYQSLELGTDYLISYDDNETTEELRELEEAF
ncbi:hypothetical protein CN918_31180 [Priestia megaterium]|nr:hypothetical protein CN918_31180 [Priestia megaterium]